ncbi:MAG: hypothetical protein QM764_22285 [Chitinophagaceae bacterium]
MPKKYYTPCCHTCPWRGTTQTSRAAALPEARQHQAANPTHDADIEVTQPRFLGINLKGKAKKNNG